MPLNHNILRELNLVINSTLRLHIPRWMLSVLNRKTILGYSTKHFKFITDGIVFSLLLW